VGANILDYCSHCPDHYYVCLLINKIQSFRTLWFCKSSATLARLCGSKHSMSLSSKSNVTPAQTCPATLLRNTWQGTWSMQKWLHQIGESIATCHVGHVLTICMQKKHQKNNQRNPHISTIAKSLGWSERTVSLTEWTESPLDPPTTQAQTVTKEINRTAPIVCTGHTLWGPSKVLKHRRNMAQNPCVISAISKTPRNQSEWEDGKYLILRRGRRGDATEWEDGKYLILRAVRLVHLDVWDWRVLFQSSERKAQLHCPPIRTNKNYTGVVHAATPRLTNAADTTAKRPHIKAERIVLQRRVHKFATNRRRPISEKTLRRSMPDRVDPPAKCQISWQWQCLNRTIPTLCCIQTNMFVWTACIILQYEA